METGARINSDVRWLLAGENDTGYKTAGTASERQSSSISVTLYPLLYISPNSQPMTTGQGLAWNWNAQNIFPWNIMERSVTSISWRDKPGIGND